METNIGSGLTFIGLDGEMSSADLPDGGRLIQAGLAMLVGDELQTTAPLISWEQMVWDPRAAQVHQLAFEDVQGAPRAEVVDTQLAGWLTERGGVLGRRELVTVVFNVNGFDHPFFRHALPGTMSMVSRRAIDLNAVCMTLAGWDPNPRNTTRDWAGWKRSAVKAGTAKLKAMGVGGRTHDAGYDAALALAAWWWLRGQIHGAHVPVRDARTP